MIPSTRSFFFFFPTSLRYSFMFRIIHRLGLKSKFHNHSIFLLPPSLPPLSLSFSLYFPIFSFPFSFAFHRSLLPPSLFPGTFHYSCYLSPPLSRQNMRRLYVCMLTLSFTRMMDKNALVAYISKTRNVPSISCHVYLTQAIYCLIYTFTFSLFLFFVFFYKNFFLSRFRSVSRVSFAAGWKKWVGGTVGKDVRKRPRKWCREESGNIVRESLFSSSFGNNR